MTTLGRAYMYRNPAESKSGAITIRYIVGHIFATITGINMERITQHSIQEAACFYNQSPELALKSLLGECWT
jgi:hypothetical protein